MHLLRQPLKAGRKQPVVGTAIFFILDETSKSFPKFNATGRILLIMFHSPSEEKHPGTYLKEFITALTDYLGLRAG